MKLKDLLEANQHHFDTGLSGKAGTEAERDFNKHHATSMYGDKLGTPAEKDTIDFDDNDGAEPGVQDPHNKETDKVERGYEPVGIGVEDDLEESTKSLSMKNLIGELDFRSQAAFDAYAEKHKMRPTTSVNVAGKDTTAGEASKKSKKPKKDKETPKKDNKVDKDKVDLPHTRLNLKPGIHAKGGAGSGRDSDAIAKAKKQLKKDHPDWDSSKINQTARALMAHTRIGKKPFKKKETNADSKKETPSLKHTPTKEDSLEVKAISNFTTLRPKALSDFINKHKLDATAIANFVKKGSLKDRMMIGVALVGNPGNEYEKKVIDKFGEKEEKGNNGGFQTPKRQGNPNVNKHAKSSAEKAGLTPQKLGNDVYKKKMLQAAVEALTDSNYHSEARELIAKIEGKPEWAKKVEYPSMNDPKFKEKMADIRTNGVDSSEYWNHDDDTRNYAIGVSQESGWDGADAADGIAFTLRMNGFHKEADAIQSIFDSKPYMKAKK